ncbi:DUF1206 domain-containing protein [Cryobacterium tepidiphilum]|uniref:DUF1206 domain-containing protein n=1 Tax=Cryobacterium tepidiphilum TaxID=2486026 RepID=UPI001F2B3C04|nr:DUF1206 domain-containing protein [Cryobacterium tepidiphilum]
MTGDGGSVKEAAQDAASTAQEQTPLRALARTGFAVSGLLHIIIGAIAVSAAVGAGGGEADLSGALHQVAKTPGGVVVLWAVVVGLVALGAWQCLQAMLARAEHWPLRWARRIKEASKAIAYFVVAGTAFRFASGGEASSSDTTRGIVRALLSAPGGMFLVMAVGIVIGSIGGVFVFRGATTRITNDLRMPTGAAGLATLVVGVVGYIAKGAALLVVGILFLLGALTSDPAKASGFDTALKTLGTLPFGDAILLAMGVGVVTYGLYLCVRTRVARL